MRTQHGKRPDYKLSVGRKGEAQAAAYLVERGFSLLAHNVRTPHGEIDLIAQKGCLTIFVEVKTRTNLAYGYPETALTKAKRAHFLAAIQFYLQENAGIAGDWRADVLAIVAGREGQSPEIVHFENVLSE
jgi:putative endonuclease